MTRAHIKGALVGVEAVTPEGLKSVFKDFNFSGAEVRDQLRRFRQHGVHVLGSFIFGLNTGAGRLISADAREHGNRNGQCASQNRESMGALARASLLASLPSEADAGSRGSEHHRDGDSRILRDQGPRICSKPVRLPRCSALVRNVRSRSLISLLAVLVLQPGPLPAEPIPVRYREGSVHGFLALRTLEGKILAAGDLTQTVRGNRVVSHLVFRFKDGSVDDETAVFSQQRNFRLISYRHIQKGPSFPNPMDVSINAPTGQVMVRHTDNGKEKVKEENLDLPPDLANGIILNILKNIRPDTAETKVSYLAATPKPRLIKLSIVSQGEDSFSVVGAPYKATLFVLKVELGGVTGVIAPLIGKQPPDTKVWVVASGTPAFVKAEQSLYPDGPVWRIEMTSPAWPNAPNSHR